LDKSIKDDIIVGAICGLIAIPICEASWHAIVTDGEIARGVVGLSFGLPIGLVGLSYHWWKDKTRFIGEAAIYWWPIAVVVAFIYVCGPIIYRRSTTSNLFTQAQVDEKITNATAPIRAEVDEMRIERDRARDKLVEATNQLNILAAKKEARLLLPPNSPTKSPILGLDDIKIMQIIRTMSPLTKVDPCIAAVSIVDDITDQQHVPFVDLKNPRIDTNKGDLLMAELHSALDYSGQLAVVLN
jgi:hypothetical protein